MYKGLVLEVKDKYSVVQSKEMGLTKIKNKGNLKQGMEIYFLDEDLYKKETFIKPYYYAAAAVLFLALIISGTSINGKNTNEFINTQTTYAFAALVSIDINPSLELELDENLIVENVRFVNEDSKELINEKMLIGKYYTLAVKDVITMAKEKGYIKDNGAVMISASSTDQENVYEVKINKQIEEVFKEEEEINLLLIKSDENTLKDSRDNDVSIGKYALYENLNDENDVELKVIKEMKVSEIVEDGIANLPESKIKIKEAKHKKDKDKENKKDEDDKYGDRDKDENQESDQLDYDEENMFVVIRSVEYISLDTLEALGFKVDESDNKNVTISNEDESLVFNYHKKLMNYEENQYIELKEVLKHFGVKYHYAGDKIKIQNSDVNTFLYYGNPAENKDKIKKENEKKKNKKDKKDKTDKDDDEKYEEETELEIEDDAKENEKKKNKGINEKENKKSKDKEHAEENIVEESLEDDESYEKYNDDDEDKEDDDDEDKNDENDEDDE